MITSKCRNVLLNTVVSQGQGTKRIKYSAANLIHRLKTTVKGRNFNSHNVLNCVYVQEWIVFFTALAYPLNQAKQPNYISYC